MPTTTSVSKIESVDKANAAWRACFDTYSAVGHANAVIVLCQWIGCAMHVNAARRASREMRAQLPNILTSILHSIDRLAAARANNDSLEVQVQLKAANDAHQMVLIAIGTPDDKGIAVHYARRLLQSLIVYEGLVENQGEPHRDAVSAWTSTIQTRAQMNDGGCIVNASSPDLTDAIDAATAFAKRECASIVGYEVNDFVAIEAELNAYMTRRAPEPADLPPVAPGLTATIDTSNLTIGAQPVIASNPVDAAYDARRYAFLYARFGGAQQ